jgi:hypothetical protein
MRHFGHGIRIHFFENAGYGFAINECRSAIMIIIMTVICGSPLPFSSSNVDVSFYVITRACGSTYNACIMSISLLKNIHNKSDTGTFQLLKKKGVFNVKTLILLFPQVVQKT